MIRNTLFAAVAFTLYASGAIAQDFDDRYYLVPSIGAVDTDSKRQTDNAGMIGLGFGKLLSPNFSLEADVNQYRADLSNVPGKWRVRGYDLTGRLFFGDDASGWRPYALLGAGTARSERTGSHKANGLDFKTGLGIQSVFTDRLSGRAEVIYRYTQDNKSIPTDDNYADLVANFGLVIALGERSSAPMVSEEARDLGTPMAEHTDEPAAEPMAEPMADDDDQDGVLNKDDKCPNTPSGQMVSKSTGCPVEEVIDLRGVNFDFDKCTLRSDAVAILNNAVDVLKGNEIMVSVEGHTDSVGSDAYNQKLSECRANVVKTYLDKNGVADKISGSAGWGESKPIATNDTDEGRAQNRRTELVRKN